MSAPTVGESQSEYEPLDSERHSQRQQVVVVVGPGRSGRVSFRISLRWERGETEKREDGEGVPEKRDWGGRAGCVWWDQKEVTGREKEEARRTRLRLACQTPSLFDGLVARSHWRRGECERGASRRPQGVPSPQRGKEKMGCEDAGMVTNQKRTRRCCGLLAGCESLDHASRSEGRASGVSTAA